MRSMDRVSSILPNVLGKRGLRDQAQAALVVHRATAWLEQRLPSSLIPAVVVHTFKDDTLTIQCRHSIALQECRSFLPALKEHLRSREDSPPVQHVRLVLAAHPFLP